MGLIAGSRSLGWDRRFVYLKGKSAYFHPDRYDVRNKPVDGKAGFRVIRRIKFGAVRAFRI